MPPARAIEPGEPGLDDRSLRAAFSRFATGVAFVTTEVDETPLGLIVSSFAAVSLQPPLVSFCPSHGSLTWQRIQHAGRFAVHMLAAGHAGFASRAAPPGADRFTEPDVLRDALASIVCDVAAEHAARDHWIVVGRVRRLRVASDSDPLVYFAAASVHSALTDIRLDARPSPDRFHDMNPSLLTHYAALAHAAELARRAHEARPATRHGRRRNRPTSLVAGGRSPVVGQY
jgi:3-hydroxy-9,10-secoandrosta-1,3,5(10)-triene-9,17-dione monooxygenase reductase component